jgi:hypothetical protein
MASRTHWIERSRAFLEVALRHRPSIPPTRFHAGIAFWCRGFPRWYKRWLLGHLEMRNVSLRPSHVQIVPQLACAFGRRLVTGHQTTIFLLGDADILARAYEAQGGKAVFCRFSRSTLPSPVYCYLDLFDLVNLAAADGSTTDYPSLYRNYRGRFEDYIRHRPKMREFLERIAIPLALSNATAIADTGMQGTLAFALCATLERLTGNTSAVHLAVSYPWLSPFLIDTTQTDAADVALAIEQTSTRGRSSRTSDMEGFRWPPIQQSEFRV